MKILCLMVCLMTGNIVAQTDSNAAAVAAAGSPSPLSQKALETMRKMVPLFDGKTLEGWESSTNAWIVKDGAMASTGAGRGVIFTKRDFGNFRLIFNMRHVSGQPDHQACVLIFCSRPPEGQKGLDALGGIQFQVPNGGHWDYRPGRNNSGKALFTKLSARKVDPHEWSQVELLVNATEGTARMAVAQPVGTRAVEILKFSDGTAGKVGPIAWQMHNKGLFDEFKDVMIETNPKENRLVTVD